jgi:hypothetical protein
VMEALRWRWESWLRFFHALFVPDGMEGFDKSRLTFISKKEFAGVDQEK